MKLGNQIKKVRLSYNMSQSRFGKKIGVSGKTISTYETGRIIPSTRVLEKIADSYSVEFVGIVSKSKSHIHKKLTSLKKAINEIENILNSGLSL